MSRSETLDLVGEMDARIWVKEWEKTLLDNPHIPLDEGAMLAWFSNALMTGYDKGRQFEQKRDLVERIREVIFQAAGAATRPLLEDHPDYIFPSERVAEAVEYVCESFGIPKESTDAAK
jgi:hypothetical protein